MALGMSREETQSLFQQYLDIVLLEAAQEPNLQDPMALMGYIVNGAGEALTAVIDENNRRLEKQLRSFGLLPPAS